MEARTIRTDAGQLDLIPATIDQVRCIARYWPMELIESPDSPGRYGLVFQRGDEEVHGIKMQPADVAEADAKLIHHVNRALVAAALPQLLMLNRAQTLQDLRVPPGNHLEALRGGRLGQHSIRINEQWRICFRWAEGDAHDVEIVDYHRG